MGKVNIVLSDGTVAAVDKEVADRLIGAQKAHAETAVEGGQRLQQAYDAENTSGVRAFAEGAADTLTLGLYGHAVSRGSLDDGHRMRATAEQNPGARALGETAAILAPTGMLGGTARAATRFSAPGLADAAGKAIGGVKGLAAEGAVLGLGASVARSNITGDPLTIESAILDVGIGAVANAGMGVLGNRIRNRAKAAETELEAAKKAAEDEEARAALITKGTELFKREHPSLVEFNHARSANIKAINKINAEIQKANDARAAFIDSPKQFRAVVKGIDDSINTVASRYRPPGTYGSVEEALAAAQAKAGVRADELALKAEGQVPSQAVSSGPGGTAVSFKQGGLTPEGVQTRIAERIKLSDKAPMSPEVAERLTRWRKDASEIRQLFNGGREINGNQWSARNPSIPRRPEEAIARIHQLKKEIWEHAQDAAGKIPDNIPSALPGKLIDAVPDAPAIKSIRYLSEMHDPTIARIANTMSKEEAEAIGRLAKDLDIKPGQTPAATLAAVHAEVKRYRAAMDAAEAAQEQAKASAGSGFGKLLHHSLRLVGARSGNRLLGGGAIGGAIGWATGNMFGGIVGGMLGTALMNGRAGLRNRINEVFVRHGARAGTAVEKLGPVASVLSTKLLGGVDGNSYDDYRLLAKNRAAEIINLRGVANDVGFIAMEPFLQAEDDIALKLHQKWTGVINHLADVAPKDPGLSIRGFDSTWVPTYNQALEFAHRCEAATDPLKAITRALQGSSHPAAADTLWTVWPGIMATFAEELVFSPEVLSGLTHSALSSWSRIFRTPLSGFQIPEIALAAQAMYLPGAAGNPYQDNPEAGFGDSPRDLSQPQGGRPPAAGRSGVAGSNPTLHQH